MGALYEQYRPKCWEEVIGQDKAVSRLLALRDKRGLGGRAFWISGPSGTGKTTVARLIAAEVADEFATEELDARALTVSALREIEASSWYRSLGKGGRAYLVNEAHGLRRDVIEHFLIMLERLCPHVVFIFTTTNEGQEKLFEGCDDTAPLLSRCLDFPMAQRGLAEAFAARVQQIAQAEGLDGKPIKAYVELVKQCRNNFRMALSAVEAGKMLD